MTVIIYSCKACIWQSNIETTIIMNPRVAYTPAAKANKRVLSQKCLKMEPPKLPGMCRRIQQQTITVCYVTALLARVPYRSCRVSRLQRGSRGPCRPYPKTKLRLREQSIRLQTHGSVRNKLYGVMRGALRLPRLGLPG